MSAERTMVEHPSTHQPEPTRAVEDEPELDDDGLARDRSATELDDERDRQELHDRYYGLLQELRVLLPGVQILVAFLFTVPFASGYERLDDAGRNLYAVSLVCGLLAVIAFATPTAFHRVGQRRSRAMRLAWGIRTTRAGLVFFAVSLVTALTVASRVVLGPTAAAVSIGLVVVALIGLWVVLPLTGSRHHPMRPGSPGEGHG